MAFAVPAVFGKLLTNIIVAIIILLLGFVVGKILGGILHKLFSSLFAGKKIRGKHNSSFALGLSSFISTLIYVAAVILATERLGITRIVILAILGAVAVILIGYVIFLVIDFFANVYFGINLLVSKKIEEGDRIKLKKIEGTVKKITLMNTQLLTDSGDFFVFSNKAISVSKFTREKKQSNA